MVFTLEVTQKMNDDDLKFKNDLKKIFGEDNYVMHYMIEHFLFKKLKTAHIHGLIKNGREVSVVYSRKKNGRVPKYAFTILFEDENYHELGEIIESALEDIRIFTMKRDILLAQEQLCK